VYNRSWLSFVVGWIRSFLDATSLHCEPRCCYDDSEISHRCNVVVKHLGCGVWNVN
jgi:hypothetical protein